MSTIGYLTDFSLIEIFQFLEKGHKTGLLTIRVLPESQTPLLAVYYIWVEQGCVVAAANQLDGQGLASLIAQRHWVSKHLLDRLGQFCPLDKPLGLCLKNQGALQTEQLKQLFHIQVVQQVFALSQLKEGQFIFEQNVPVPTQEMTGLSIPVGSLILLLEAVNHVQQAIDELQPQALKMTIG